MNGIELFLMAAKIRVLVNREYLHRNYLSWDPRTDFEPALAEAIAKSQAQKEIVFHGINILDNRISEPTAAYTVSIYTVQDESYVIVDTSSPSTQTWRTMTDTGDWVEFTQDKKPAVIDERHISAENPVADRRRRGIGCWSFKEVADLVV